MAQQKNFGEKTRLQRIEQNQNYLFSLLMRWRRGLFTRPASFTGPWVPTAEIEYSSDERIKIAEVSTMLHPITPLPHTAIQAVAPRPVQLLPNTDPIDMRVTQEEKPNSDAILQRQIRERAERTQSDLIAHIQHLIRVYYHAHGNIWPATVEISASHMLFLSSSLIDGYFPETPVKVVTAEGCLEPVCKPPTEVSIEVSTPPQEENSTNQPISS